VIGVLELFEGDTIPGEEEEEEEEEKEEEEVRLL